MSNELIGSTLNYTGTFFSLMFVATFLENTIFTRALGTSTVLLMLRKKANLFLFGMVLTIITVIASIVTYFLNPWLSIFENAYYIRPFAYVAVIGVVYVIAVLTVSRLPKHYSSELKPMIHLSAFNCTVLGALLLENSLNNLTLLSAVGFGLGSGIGFMLATFLLAVSYPYLYSDHIPKPFRGFPITMIYIGILSMAFYGLIGHQLPV